jgi:hypothetical protein
MTPCVRAFATIVVGFVGLAGICCGQSTPQVTEVKQPVRANELSGTKVKKTPVKTTDDISLLETDRPEKNPEVSKVSVEDAESGAPGVADSPEKLQAEMVAVQQQIKGKQKRVEFLMHMFVTDERAFLIDPGGQSADPDTAAKRRFEQEELHKETAEIAVLRAKLELLTLRAEKTPQANP